MDSLETRIAELGLAPHPEGGFYRETHRSTVVLPDDALPDHPGDRVAVTSILFLLPTGVRSRWHCVRSEELWLFQEGDPLRLRIAATLDASEPKAIELATGGTLQAVVPPGWWQDAEALPGPTGYALVGCVVAPGFEFEDFELAAGDD
ncbi:MAG: cupin domain-containing protein [Planctomycetota bacterium]|nr:cupin domain-containing protein [Planctomycetota bacterium]